MQELPDTLLKETNPIFVDTPTALTESGDMLRAKELQGEDARFMTLEEIVGHSSISDKQRYTVFKSVGMALFDLIAAKTIYEKNIRNFQHAK